MLEVGEDFVVGVALPDIPLGVVEVEESEELGEVGVCGAADGDGASGHGLSRRAGL